MRAKRAVRGATVAILSTGVMIAGLTTMADAKTAAKLIVAPAVGLTNNKTVIVKGTGFRAKDQVYVTECLRTAKGAAQCDTSTALPVTITSRGVLPATKFKVITGLIGTAKCGTSRSNLAKCAISVGNISGGDTASTNIVFAAPKK